jgi:hemolysin III
LSVTNDVNERTEIVESHVGKYSVLEEVLNALTHGVGALLSAAGLTALVILAVLEGDPWRVTGVAVFGTALVLLYASSTLYHAIPHPKAKRVLRVCDHCAIYCLIAGTYTPFLLVNLRGTLGYVLLAVLWSLAIGGCIFKLFFIGRLEWFSTAAYVGMGWIAVVGLERIVSLLPGGALVLLVLGGLSYTGGVIFYVWDRIPFNHALWHVFVLCGSLFHFLAVLFYVVPAPLTAP